MTRVEVELVQFLKKRRGKKRKGSFNGKHEERRER
jgi:hypothetical protein